MRSYQRTFDIPSRRYPQWKGTANLAGLIQQCSLCSVHAHSPSSQAKWSLQAESCPWGHRTDDTADIEVHHPWGVNHNRLEASVEFLQAKSAQLGMTLAYRTVQYPQMENCTLSSRALDWIIGERYHVTYLNAAGREVRATSNVLMYLDDSQSLSV